LNYTAVTGFIKEQGNVRGVRVTSDGGTFDLHADAVVNATGVWMQKVTELTGLRSRTHVAPAKGIHLTFSQARLPIKTAMIVPSVHDDRFCFAVPWYDSVVVGTTDTPYDGDLENLVVTREETDYCLDALNAMFPGANFT